MIEWWRDLVRGGYKRIQPAWYRSRSDADLVNGRRHLSLLPQMVRAVEQRHLRRNAFSSVSLLIGHRPKAHTLSEKLNQLRDDLKTEDEMILRKLHAKHRNGQDS